MKEDKSMGEYISREWLRKWAVEVYERWGNVAEVQGYFVLRMPEVAPAADVVEVVRCKDCKHLMFSDCYGECSAGHYGIVRPDHFCNYGERKEDA
jgi:hypothetical protein